MGPAAFLCLAIALVALAVVVRGLHLKVLARSVALVDNRVDRCFRAVDVGMGRVDDLESRLRRAEAEIRALTERLVRLERVAPTTEDDVVKILSQPPEL